MSTSDNQQAIIQDLQEKLRKAEADWDLEHELHMGTERDLKAVQHDRDLQDKQMRELREEYEGLKKQFRELTKESLDALARAAAQEAKAKVYREAAADIINRLLKEEDDAEE